MPYTMSYLTLRRLLGVLGTAMPFFLWFGGRALFGEALQSSVSHYYHTMMRDIFVAFLFAIGVFLITYKGYKKDADELISDNAACYTAGFAAIVVALFRTTDVGSGSAKCDVDTDILGYVHLAAAATFFLMMAYISIFKFTRSGGKVTPQKPARNRIYRICGWVIVAMIAAIIIHSVWDGLCLALADIRPVFFLEAIAIISFGIAWLTKGDVLYADQ